MIAYVDSSVLLRLALGEPDPVPQWEQLEFAVTSDLARIECLRTIDRLRIRAGLRGVQVATLHERIEALLEAMELIALGPEVLKRAAEPFSTTLATLDAIHLASALLWQDYAGRSLDALLTHDLELGAAARTTGLRAYGC